MNISFRALLINALILQFLGTCAINAPVLASQAQVMLPDIPPQAEGAQTTIVDDHLYSLPECIKIALENNPDTKSSWEHSRAAAAAVGQAKAAYLPSADINVEANRGVTANLDSQQESAATDTYSAGFGVRYLLFDGGARRAGLKGAEAALMAANFRHNTTLQEIAFQVESIYYQLLAAKEMQKVAEETIHQIQYHVDIAKARHLNGLVTKSDQLKAETEKADADLQLVRAKSQVRIISGQLANSMGLRPSTPIKVGNLPHDPGAEGLRDIKQLMAEAVQHRPELQAALSIIKQNRTEVDAANSRYWPDITLNTDYGKKDRSLLPDREQWDIGVGLSLPLFDGFHRQNTVRQAQAELAAASAEYTKLLQGVELETWTAYAQLIEASQAIAASKSLVKSAEESARVSEGEYKNGTTTIIDLTDAQTARTTANFRMVQAKLDWYIAMTKLERALGKS